MRAHSTGPRTVGLVVLGVATACLVPGTVAGQVIDTVIVERRDIFPPESARGHFLQRLLNRLHVTTRPWVVRQELLVERGMAWDSALAQETERNLRRRRLFRAVEVDTQRVSDRLAATVRTVDAWSILPRLEAQVAADGTLTGAVGGTETNLLGTGNLLRAWYVKEAERDGLVLAAAVPRVSGTRFGTGASFQDLSDRTAGSWSGGLAFHSLSDRWSASADGEAFDGRVLAFRSESAAPPDTVRWQRRALVQRFHLAVAPAAGPRGYTRIGLAAEVRREEYFARRLALVDSARFVPDTVYGLVGAWAEARRADFRTLRHFNGFTEEDQDLSRLVFLSVKLAPGGWGYGDTGIGVRGLLAAGGALGRGPPGAVPEEGAVTAAGAVSEAEPVSEARAVTEAEAVTTDAPPRADLVGREEIARMGAGPLLLFKLLADAHGLFDGAGLDSGRVVLRGTAALRPARRQVTFLALSGTLLDHPAPGTEIDLGFRAPPRLWHPHAFTGTRSFGLTLEHRWYVWDGVLDLFGLGLAGFLDYGGAWFGDQPARFGGDVGGALLIGWPLRATPILTQLSLGWRFAGGIGRSDRGRWGASLGTGLRF